MSEAAEAAQKFVENAGQKDTTVHETVAPAVTQETIVPQHHEEITAAVDKEVHQEHYHTSVLPIEQKEVLPEKHESVVHDVKQHEHKHGDVGILKRLIEEEAAAFKDFKHEAEAIITHKEAPAVKGEHVHHHVHEVIQPVVQKETVVPTVVHTTIPIHEVHHNEAKHHTATSLPPISMAEFQKQGGVLTGRSVRTEKFTSEPRAAGEAASTATVSASASGDQAPSRPLTRSPTGPSQQRRSTMKESSQGAKEV